jgi:hypothetical protein
MPGGFLSVSDGKIVNGAFTSRAMNSYTNSRLVTVNVCREEIE